MQASTVVSVAIFFNECIEYFSRENLIIFLLDLRSLLLLRRTKVEMVSSHLCRLLSLASNPELRSCLGLDVQRAGVSSCGKLGQRTAGQVDVERHDVIAAGALVSTSDSNVGQLQTGKSAAERNGVYQGS